MEEIFNHHGFYENTSLSEELKIFFKKTDPTSYWFGSSPTSHSQIDNHLYIGKFKKTGGSGDICYYPHGFGYLVFKADSMFSNYILICDWYNGYPDGYGELFFQKKVPVISKNGISEYVFNKMYSYVDYIINREEKFTETFYEYEKVLVRKGQWKIGIPIKDESHSYENFVNYMSESSKYLWTLSSLAYMSATNILMESEYKYDHQRLF